MNESIHSPDWHWVAELRPALTNDLRSRRVVSRGETWRLLSSPDHRQQVRLNDAAWSLVGLFDGERTLDSLWQRLWQRDGEAAPSQGETMTLLAQLEDAGMLKTDRRPDTERRFANARRRERTSRLAAFNPLSIRVPLVDPSGWIDRAVPHLRWLLSPAFLVVWAGFVLWTALSMAADAPILGRALSENFNAPRFLLIGWVVYPLMKLVHELAHGLVIHRLGGQVRSAGITLLIMLPVPWVDGTPANRFEPLRRLLVSAAGIMSELFMAAIAWWLWSWAEPGLLRDVALTVVIIGTVSSLLFNGNPLLRFDGYHMLTDALDLPNLAHRSRRWWQHLIGRRLFAAAMPDFQASRGEGFWLFAYAPASLVFQLWVGLRIVQWLAHQVPLAGLVVLAALVILVVILPIARAVYAWRGLAATPATRPARWRLIAGAVGILILAALPFPSATVVPAVLDLPPDAVLRTRTEGRIDTVLVADGAPVRTGDPIIRLVNDALVTRADTLRAQLQGLESQRYASLLTDPKVARDLGASIEATRAELGDVERRVDALWVRARRDGRVSLGHADDLPGRWLHEGETVGHVLSTALDTIIARVPDHLSDRIRVDQTAADVRLAGAPDAHHARITGMSAGAITRLDSPALSERFGGPIAVRPGSDDQQTTLEAHYVLRLTLDAPVPGWVGERAWVRFEHPPESLARQAGRALRQTFITWFGASTT